MRAAFRLFVVLSGLVVAACIPESDAFLSDPGAQPLDKRIAGTWFARAKNEREQITLNIIPRGDNTYAITWVMLLPKQRVSKSEKPVAWIRYRGHTTEIDGQTFVNLSLIHAEWPNAVPKRMIMRYWLGGDDQLRFSFMHDRQIELSIKAGDLTGTTPKDGFRRITSNRKALIAYIRKIGPDKAFRRPSKPLRRMPVTQ